MLKKLDRYGIRGTENRWLESYLRDRKQIVKLTVDSSETNTMSDVFGMTRGIPQGSTLGPLLFNIFVNDIPSSNNGHIVSYADDTNILLMAATFPEVADLGNKIMKNLEEWFTINNLKLNHEKTNCMLFKCNNNLPTPTSINLNNKNYLFTAAAKFLGITLDETLSYKEHTENLSSKLNKACYGLRILSKNTNLAVSKIFYFSYFYSHLKYGIPFWGSSTHINSIFLIQKRAIRIMYKLKYDVSCRGFFKRANILTCYGVYIYECIKFFVKHKHLFEHHLLQGQYNTRHGIEFSYPRHKLAFFEKGTEYSCIKLYNNIPKEIKEIKSYNLLKKKIYEYLVASEPYSIYEYFNP